MENLKTPVKNFQKDLVTLPASPHMKHLGYGSGKFYHYKINYFHE